MISVINIVIMNNTYSDLDSVLQLSKDNETSGFDLVAGETWIYPTNYQVRDYQYNITQAALHNNTMVSLPTGLGKTFIAAVVMYNFYRWYPLGKIIFMAPTKPLVKQQQDACYNIMAIPVETTAEMTGHNLKASRLKIWKEKRVFFITPHILQNDIDIVLDLAEQIKCIVIDEAHRALGKNANCEAIKKIRNANKYFRVLALSATPGNNFNSVKDVITNLLISHIEARTNESADVAPYVFNRKLETCVIPITGELLSVKNKYIMVLDKYTRPLLQYNIFNVSCANLSKGRILFTMKEFKEKGRHHTNYGFILKTLTLCVTLYHGYELLIRHGLRGFLVFFDGTTSNALINSIQELSPILDSVRNYLGPQEEVAMLPDGTIPEVEGPIKYSHPKFEKLSEVLIDHFKTNGDGDTRVMVFCEYRESVMEIYQMLLRQRPLIKPRVFLGQGQCRGQGGISQVQQLQAVKQFKSGACNTLISTCIGEEGLDVGEVDLIVCFDIHSKSPIRMVQRMGRTGRKRDGRVVVLVTEGQEEKLLTDCLVQKNNMISLLESQPIKQHLYTENPKMIPDNIQLRCNKMFITVQETEKPEKTKKKGASKKKTTETKKSNTLKNMFENIASQSSSKTSEEDNTSRRQKSPQKGSRGSKKLKTPQKNQLDLRNMFSKINSTQNTLNTSQTCSQDISIYKPEENPKLNLLATKIKSYLDERIINKSNCDICTIFNNKLFCLSTKNKVNTVWKKPNLSILDSITSESLTKFSESLTPNKNIQINNRSTMGNKSVNSTVANNSLQFFNLESTFDVFSDSAESEENYTNQDPVIFNQSLGIFESSKIYHSPLKTDICKKEINENQNKGEHSLIKSQEHSNIEDIIIDSDFDSPSPVLCTQRVINIKQKIKKKLFTQSEIVPEDTTEKREIGLNNLQEKTEHNEKNNKSVHFSSPLIKTNVKNTNISTPKNNNEAKKEYNMDFWDESLFEMSDDSLFEEECNNADKKLEEKIEKQDDSNKNNSINENQNDSDSDATVILSFNTDNIFEEIEKEKLKFETNDLPVKKDSPIKIDSPILNKSVCNKTVNSSLLSVTQAVELLNDSKFKFANNSFNINSTNNPGNNQILNADINKTAPANDIKEVDKSVSEPNVTEVNKESNKLGFDDLEISQIFQDFCEDSEEEFSLLNFSQKRKRKIQQKTENNNNAKSMRLSTEKNTEDKIQNTPVLNKNETISHCSNTNLENGTTKKTPTTNILKDKHEKNTEDKIQFSLNINEKLISQNSNTNLENVTTKKTPTNILKDKHEKNTKDKIQFSLNKNEKFISQSSNTNLENVITKKTPTTNILKDKHEKNREDKIQFTSNKNEKLVSQSSNTNLENVTTKKSPATNILKDKHDNNEDEFFCQATKKMRSKRFKLTTLKNISKKLDDTVNNTQSSPIKPPKKVTDINKPVIVVSDSDDDFEIRPTIKPSKLITPVKKVQRTASVPSYSKSNENVQQSSKFKSRSQSYSSKTAKEKKKKNACLFIDDEAEVEDDEHYISDSDSEKDSEELDCSFVSFSQNPIDQTDMRGKYLQSIRSPKFKPGAFKMPHRLPTQIYDDVFSQRDNIENDTYMNDSFCVDNDHTLTQRNGMSYLEMVEAQLEEREEKNKKRKRIITISDSD